MVGLPFGITDMADPKAFIKQIKAWMVGRHEWSEGKRKRVANVVSMQALGQADACLYDYDLDNEVHVSGRMIAGKTFGVLTIGH